MENAAHALLIAGGVLIGVLILTLGIALFSDLTTYVQSSQETIKFNELNAFNTQFLNYVNNDKLTIQDVVTAANLANENNASYDYYINSSDEEIELIREDESQLYVAVYLNGNPIEANIQTEAAIKLNDYSKIDEDTGKLPTFTCEVEISNVTGRVYKVYFK